MDILACRNDIPNRLLLAANDYRQLQGIGKFREFLKAENIGKICKTFKNSTQMLNMHAKFFPCYNFRCHQGKAASSKALTLELILKVLQKEELSFGMKKKNRKEKGLADFLDHEAKKM